MWTASASRSAAYLPHYSTSPLWNPVPCSQGGGLYPNVPLLAAPPSRVEIAVPPARRINISVLRAQTPSYADTFDPRKRVRRLDAARYARLHSTYAPATFNPEISLRQAPYRRLGGAYLGDPVTRDVGVRNCDTYCILFSRRFVPTRGMCSAHLPFYGHKYYSLHHSAGEAVTICRIAETLGYVRSASVCVLYQGIRLSSWVSAGLGSRPWSLTHIYPHLAATPSGANQTAFCIQYLGKATYHSYDSLMFMRTYLLAQGKVKEGKRFQQRKVQAAPDEGGRMGHE